MRPAVFVATLTWLAAGAPAWAQPTGHLIVRVLARTGPVEQAEVHAGDTVTLTDASGLAAFDAPAGPLTLLVTRFGFDPATRGVTLAAGATVEIAVTLEPVAVLAEDVVVTSARTPRRIRDLPLRVEVVEREEIDEKLAMTPGNVAMLLTETNGVRVQVASPSLGTASVRIRGLGGRYTQLLADGLPLYGSMGTIGVLQVPPLDLGQVEVLKGVASALYGASALGGAINLVSRQAPAEGHEREVLLNRTSLGGADAIVWLAGRPTSAWSYSLLAGGHVQDRVDRDADGWTDVPTYRRAMARPRVQWADGRGRSVFLTAGLTRERRSGGSVPGRTAPDGQPFPESLGTTRIDAGVVARAVVRETRVLTLRGSTMALRHDLLRGREREQDVHGTGFLEGSLTGAHGAHTWVAGAAMQFDRYRHAALPDFDYTYAVPGLFLEDDYRARPWLAISASGRVDHHNVHGLFASPRVSALASLGDGWSLRASAGSGFSSATPFTDTTEATGLAGARLPRPLEAERAVSASVDATWHRGPLELTASVFRAAVRQPIVSRDGEDGVLEIINAPGAFRVHGTEAIARLHQGEMDLIATHVWTRGTESAPGGGRQEAALTPRHSVMVDWLFDFQGLGRLGLEAFLTGSQRLENSPYLRRSPAYVLFGIIGEVRVGRARVFVNGENLTGRRLTSFERLVRPTQAAGGRWTVDVWGPLEGRVVNAGLRFGL
ncbi:MAG: TonB-dependent receptor [Vicinamibacterales bacterium]